MARPALAVVFGGQQPLHQLLIGQRGFVIHKGLHLLRRGQQAGEVQRHAADECAAVGLGRKGEPLLRHRLEQKGVHRRAYLAVVHLVGHGRSLHRLKGPVFTVIIRNDRPWCQRQRLRLGRLCPLGDPLLDGRQLGLGERLALLGHLAVFDQAHQLALLRMPGHDDLAATVQLLIHEAPQSQIHAALGLLLLAMAVGAVRLDDGAHVFFKREHTLRAACGHGEGAKENGRR